MNQNCQPLEHAHCRSMCHILLVYMQLLLQKPINPCIAGGVLTS